MPDDRNRGGSGKAGGGGRSSRPSDSRRSGTTGKRSGKKSGSDRSGQKGSTPQSRGGGRRTQAGDSSGRAGGSAGSRKGGSGHDRRAAGGDQSRTPRRAFSADGGPSNIPRWLKEEIVRVTPKDRRDSVLVLFSDAASDFADEKFGRAHGKLLKAKQMASRASAIRELLGLTAYRMQRWDEALRELRAFRRMAGDTTHMPVEMDVLRALGRPTDVHKVWDLFQELGGRPLIDAEARVVYGSFLLDEGDPRRAWEVTKPKRVTKEARTGDLRRWYVAARAAAALGDTETARQIARAIAEADEAREISGLDALDTEIAAAAKRLS